MGESQKSAQKAALEHSKTEPFQNQFKEVCIDTQKASFVNQSLMRRSFIKIVCIGAIVAGSVHYFSPNFLSKFGKVDFAFWGSRILAQLHLQWIHPVFAENQIQVAVKLLRDGTHNNGVKKLIGIHRAIQKITQTPLFHDEDVDRAIGEIQELDQELKAALRGLTASQLQGDCQNKARVLEQMLLTRLHELIAWRKMCESSYRHAVNDPLFENVLVPVPEVISTAQTPVPDNEGGTSSVTSSEIRRREMEALRTKIKAEDDTRRRQHFVQGTKQRWKENSARLRALIAEDLKRLDVLMASALL